MAGPRDSRMLSVMSSIKCAGCGKAIDIVALADHLCEANLVKTPAAPTPKKKLYGDPAIQTSTSSFEDDKPLQPAAGFFNWRKPIAPAMIDTNGANQAYDSPPELSGSDYSEENRSISPVTPSTQITSPGSTWSRGQIKGLGMSDTQSQSSPRIEESNTSEAIAETTTRLGGLWGGGLFKRLNNVAAGPFVPAEAVENKALPTTPTKEIPAPDSISSGKPKFRNAAGRDLLNLQNSTPSPMKEVYSQKPQIINPSRIFADIEESNPFSKPFPGASLDSMRSPIAPETPPKTPQKDGWSGFDYNRGSIQLSPLKSEFSNSKPDTLSSTRSKRNNSSDSSFWNSPSSEMTRSEVRPFQNRLQAPAFKTVDPAIQKTPVRSFGLGNNQPSFSTPLSEPKRPKPKMFPEAIPLGAPPAPRFHPAPTPRYARNEFDMYQNNMTSTPSSVNSSPARYPFGQSHTRKMSDASSLPSVPSSNSSSSGSTSVKHICRGCARPILGRSLKDSSGRLTGRYHRDCFRCSCCTAPFPSGEFYVLGNEPLCKRDYHERNGTQCSKCRGGIEGRYVETDRRQMFHDGCFNCAECDINLGEEYWEVDGRPMCQRHAMVMSRTNSKLRPGVGVGLDYRSPQKRMTRYGMTDGVRRF